MLINKININKFVSFGKERDENQPISPQVREIFKESAIPASTKKVLWELSEVPGFYEASAGADRKELLELADLFESQNTNILKMAVDGDVKVIKKSKQGSPKLTRLLSFFDFVRQNEKKPQSERISLVDYLKSHFVHQVEEDAIAQYYDTKKYPKEMRYIVEKGPDGKSIYSKISEVAASIKNFSNVLNTGNLYADDDVDVVFEDTIEKQKGYKVRGYIYDFIDPEDVELDNPQKYSQLFYFLIDNPKIPFLLRKGVDELSKIPYFANLARTTNPNVILMLADYDLKTGNILEKMLRQEVFLDVRNPLNGKYVHTPLIDIGRLLLGRNSGKIKEKDVGELLLNNTIAFEAAGLYSLGMSKLGGKEPAQIVVERFGNALGCRFEAADGALEKFLIDGDDPVKDKILSVVDKLPFKRAIINFNHKK